MSRRSLLGILIFAVVALPLSAKSRDRTQKLIRHAATFVSTGKLLPAEKILKSVLAQDPNNEDARLLMAETLRRITAKCQVNGNEALVVEQLRIALGFDPTAPYIHRDLAKALYFAGHHEEAAEECEKAAKLSPDDSGLAAGCGLGVAINRPAAEFTGIASINSPFAADPSKHKGNQRLPWFSQVPDPPYSKPAKEVGLRGVCVVVATVSADGDVQDAAVLQSVGMGLDQIALQTIKTWKFHPMLFHGKPVPSQVLLSTAFHSS